MKRASAGEPYKPPLSSAAALIDATTEVHSRLARVAPYATPNARIRLMGELALIATVLDSVEREVRATARACLKGTAKRRALPPVTHDAKVAGLPFDPALSPEAKP